MPGPHTSSPPLGKSLCLSEPQFPTYNMWTAAAPSPGCRVSMERGGPASLRTLLNPSRRQEEAPPTVSGLEPPVLWQLGRGLLLASLGRDQGCCSASCSAQHGNHSREPPSPKASCTRGQRQDHQPQTHSSSLPGVAQNPQPRPRSPRQGSRRLLFDGHPR